MKEETKISVHSNLNSLPGMLVSGILKLLQISNHDNAYKCITTTFATVPYFQQV